LKQDLTLAKIHMLLGRRGVVVPYRTLHRFAVAELGFGRRQPTVRVADGKPGQEVQVDFGRLGLLPEPTTGRRRVAQGLIFTAVYSRHMFVYPTLRQTLEDVVAGVRGRVGVLRWCVRDCGAGQHENDRRAR
jgi:hypothetical protein